MKIIKDSQGIALMVVIMIMAILLSITGASLLFSGLNLKIVSNLKTTSAAIHVADAGIQHALALIPSGTTFAYTTETTLLNSYSFGNGYTYTVTAINDAASSGGNTRAVFIAAASASNSSARKVKAYIGRSTASWVPPGTIYVPAGSGSDANFNTAGTFFIDGNDTNYSADLNLDGRADSMSAGPKPPIYGVAALQSSLVTEFINSLSSSEKTRVQGNGYNASTSPVTPSVFQTSTTINVTSLVDSFKSQPGVVQYLSGLDRSQTDCPTPPPVPMTSNCIFGTDAAPQITYIKADTGTIKFHTNSTVVGSGVLILDGKANLFGNFEFHGLVISLAPGPRGDENIEGNIKLKLKDNARIFGSLLLGPNGDELKFDIKDHAAIYYSNQALNMVKNLWGSCCLPQPAKLVAWHEVMQ